MLIFAIGDVVGEGGVDAVCRVLPPFRRLRNIDFVICNGENTAGLGILPAHAERLYGAGVDVITLGNHTFSRKETARMLEEDRYLLRPANFTAVNPGRGFAVFDAPRGKRVAVMNLMGRLYLDANLDNPFTVADTLLRGADTRFILVDMHAEATSEKTAMAYHLDGRVSAVFGTHTHVQTADERILSGGTGYLGDLGMSGPVDSVLGMDPESSVRRFLGEHVRHTVAGGECELQGALFTLDDADGHCTAVERIKLRPGVSQ